ncbi:hypothetical protein N2152v2_000668 [Parachlorella kessleri]
MEQTPEGLAAAAATREAAKQKKRQFEDKQGAPPPKRAVRPGAACTHEVAIPEDYDVDAAGLDPSVHGTIHNPKWEGKLAKEYPFVLDPFQQVAVACLERKESVFVAAHTSAGKTVVAEYATALAFKQGQRVVYTSPLKALSNQKFRELSEEFGDVGLMTGDVSINPNANCIVMTTEILRSMIYRGSELLREIAWVIFDEVHYMQDRERGVVWEETIIFMPRDARMVFLSATLPNAFEFAQWVAYIHKAPCHVVYTDYRPTPLRHYAFPAGGNGLYLVVDEQGNFREDNFAKLREAFGADEGGNEGKAAALIGSNGKLGDPPDHRKGAGGRGTGGTRQGGGSGKKQGGGKGGGGGSTGEDLKKIVGLIKQKNLNPVIVFSFSRRECEQYAMQLEQLDFNNDEEKEEVETIYLAALQCLSEGDRVLPAVEHMLPLLLRGIGVHHSGKQAHALSVADGGTEAAAADLVVAGLLPILKEVVEILFQEGLVKCLFSTETFAMGLNMPARTVVFTALRKWDGEEHRWMGSGEYIQMSGRAGRRGKDDRGVAIMMVDDQMDEPTCRAMVQGKANPLLSSFKLSYYTLLNLMRRMEGTGANMEYVIAHSFSQFQHERQLPQMTSRLKALEAEAETITDVTTDAVQEYNSLKERVEELDRQIRQAILQPDRCLHFLRPGRIVRFRDETGLDWGYGVVVSVIRQPPQERGRAVTEAMAPAYNVDVLAVMAGDSLRAGQGQPANPSAEDAEVGVIPVQLPLLTAISTLRISIPPDLRAPDSRRAVLLTLRELPKRYGPRLPELDPLQDLGLEGTPTEQAVTQRQQLQKQLEANTIYQAELTGEGAGVEPLKRKAALLAEAEALRRRMAQSELTSFQEEARNRSVVLRKLGHINEEGVVQLKGRAACEIDTADELLATELMFNGTFNSLDKHKLVALVSTLVPVDKSNEQIKLTAELGGPLKSLQDTARHIAEVSNEYDYLESFRPFLMDVIHAWSKGASFAEICGMTDMFEGSIVRATRRLDELMQQLEHAAAVVGDTTLAGKFAESRETIRRDIMFAASLYVSQSPAKYD